jgi:ribosomal protein L29
MDMDDNELLFPTSEAERRQMQDELVEALGSLATIRANAKVVCAEARGEVAKAEKHIAALATILRQSRPPKS